MIFKFFFAIRLCFQNLWKISSLSPCFCSKKKNASKKQLILFTFSLYFFLLIRSLFVCLLVMFTLLVVTLLTEKSFAKKNFENGFSNFHFFCYSVVTCSSSLFSFPFFHSSFIFHLLCLSKFFFP